MPGFAQELKGTDPEPKKKLINRNQVELVKDTPIFKKIADKKPLDPKENPEEFTAFTNILLHARSFDASVLEEFSHKSVTYESMTNDEQRPNFLRELVKIKGNLVRLRSERNLPNVFKAQGVEQLYAAWVVLDKSPEKMVFFYFTELPDTVRPNEKLNIRIEADGFYFKLLEYTADKDEGVIVQVKQYAPMLLGRTIKILDEEETPFAKAD
ncbi:MAG: hypothetical protein K8T89_25250, partial [Planctomycetes bacterium]|nr:hypothetical protein [Planctomycetota bacterium]